MRLKQLVIASCFFFLSLCASAQQATQTTATVVAQRAFAALTGSVPVADVTLSGTATRIAGSDEETGSITLKARGTSESRMDHVLPGGTRSEVRNSASGVPQGQWSGLDRVAHPMAGYNCLTGAAWFFPAFSVLSQLTNPNLSVAYVGEETKNEIAVHHLRFILHDPSMPANIAAQVDQITATDIYVDASSFLPVAIAFNTHSDDARVNIPVEVDFSDYRVVQGVPVPFRIQKFLNGSLFLDVTVQTATVNSGLNDAEFSVQSF